MDFSQAAISANAPISDINPVNSFATGAQQGLANQKSQIENTNAAYQQQLTFRLQKAIQESIGDNGMPDPVKLRAAGAKYGISQQMVEYAISQFPKIWNAAGSISKSKNQLAASSPEGEKALTASWATKPAGQNTQVGVLSPTSPTPNDTNTGDQTTQQQEQAQPIQNWATQTAKTAQPEPDTTGFTTPDMLNAAPSGYDVAGTGVSGQGQSATDQGLTQNPSALEGEGTGTPDQQAQAAQAATQENLQDKSFFGQANAMEPDMGNQGTTETPTNPLQLSTMDKTTQDKMLAQLRQEGKLGQWGKGDTREGYLSKGQAALDTYLNGQIKAVGDVPTRQMFMDKEGTIDNGAYLTALAKYHGDAAKAVQEVTDKYGKAYGDQLAQSFAIQGNERATEANQRARTEFDQVQQLVTQQRNEGYNSNAGNAQTIATLEGNKNSLQDAHAELQALLPQAGKIGIDELNSKLAVVEKAMAQAAGVTTEAADNRLFQSFRKDATWGAIARNSTDIKDFLANAFRTGISAQNQKQLLTLLDNNITTELNSGTNAAKLDAYKIKANPKNNWANKKAGSTSAPTKSGWYKDADGVMRKH